jgi:hypothetical protein
LRTKSTASNLLNDDVAHLPLPQLAARGASCASFGATTAAISTASFFRRSDRLFVVLTFLPSARARSQDGRSKSPYRKSFVLARGAAVTGSRYRHCGCLSSGLSKMPQKFPQNIKSPETPRQQELADRMNTAKSVISRRESGQHPTPPQTLRWLGTALEGRALLGFDFGTQACPERELVGL